MDERRELLRRLLSATGARLTPAQHEEILGHFEDSVEAKIAGGASEMESAVRSLEELGDLPRIAGQFPATAPVLATADGPGIRWAVHGPALQAYLAILAFCMVQVQVLPKFVEIFRQVAVALPPFTLFYVRLSAAMSNGWGWVLTLVSVMAIGVAMLGLARHRFARIATFVLGIGAILLIVGAVISVGLPLIAIGRAH